MKIYLSEVKINGIKCIDNEISLKFTSFSLKNKEENNIKAIYGPNGSGKSAIVLSLLIYKKLMISEDGLALSSLKKVLTKNINKKTNQFDFEIIFVVNDNKIYKHHLQIINDKNNLFIKKENIFFINGNSLTNAIFKNIVSIENGKIISLIHKNSLISKEIINNTNNLFNKKSIVNCIANSNCGHELFDALKSIKGLANNIIVNIDEQIIDEKDNSSLISESSILKYEKEFSINGLDEVYINQFDDYCYKINQLYKFIKVFKPEINNIEIEKKQKEYIYYCNKLFDYIDYKIDIQSESNGIKKLVSLFNSLFLCSNGKIVFIDELDSNIHSVYFNKLIEFIKNYSCGQLCFTTHNISTIDVIKDKSYSIEFLSNDSKITSWRKNGNSSPTQKYIYGLIENSNFNVESFDFISSLVEDSDTYED